MNLLKDFTRTINEAEGMSSIPLDKFKAIQKNIRDGANDIAQKWANALELLHRAYKVANVERPSPEMTDAWKQYEENLHYAVQQLSKARGMDADWRMSAAMFHESEQKLIDFHVSIKGGGEDLDTSLKGSSIQDIKGQINDGIGSQYDFELVDELHAGQKFRIVSKGPVQSKTNIYVTIERK